ncbi:hypothetical protein [Streptococcus salivarius]|uniref:hypothetical protein n=1 Tax=Streptococcus salivarius TaxID=1304 RepID=UPI0012BD54D6|nr:hypothetical protein [Streptococcus salivarius]MTQ57904.1 hypothetical protein [Streptococcus salivarius]MTQ59861.1 hypothetical protein [Streptococcus salivarius]MTQ65482.1 hypothetical protein [Streptococcus salivarius]MTQ67381.1 hypothetical protein [Streptococcus salivarius]MTQ71930.1 hypothetical protein [Streptococcus salivarius]
MVLDFTIKNHIDLYDQLCTEAKKNLECTKKQIRDYFTKENLDELELYREKIHVAKLRSEEFDSSVRDTMFSVFIPTLASSVTLAIVAPFRLAEGSTPSILIPFYIAGTFLVLNVGRQAWIRRKNSKSEQEWTNINRVMYFLENYQPE